MISADEQRFGDVAADLAAALERLVPAAERAAQVLVGAVKAALRDHGAVATGQTMQSVCGGVDRVSDGLEVWVGGNRTLRFVREGRGPGTPPPYGPIAEWARSKSAHSAAQAAKPGRRTPLLHLYGGKDQAFLNLAFAFQRRWALRRHAEGHLLTGEAATGGWSRAEQKQRIVARIRPLRLPPLERVIAWMEENGIQPTHAQAFAAMVRSIQLGIGKRGTRRFRGEVPDPVALGIREGLPDALAALRGSGLTFLED